MKQCPACQHYNMPSYAVCERCHADLPKGGDGALYRRGFVELLKTEFGIRLFIGTVVFVAAVIWILIKG